MFIHIPNILWVSYLQFLNQLFILVKPLVYYLGGTAKGTCKRQVGHPCFTLGESWCFKNRLNHLCPAISFLSKNPMMSLSTAKSYVIDLISFGVKGNPRRAYSSIMSTNSSKKYIHVHLIKNQIRGEPIRFQSGNEFDTM